MKPEEIKSAYQKARTKLREKDRPVDEGLELFQAGYDYALSQALLKVDGDLVKVIRQYFVDNDCKATNAFEEGLAKAIAPQLQATADKEREIERLRERIDADQYLKDEMFLKSEVDDRISQAVQQERERIVNYLKDNGKFSSGKDSFGNYTQINFRKPIKEIWQALEGKYE